MWMNVSTNVMMIGDGWSGDGWSGDGWSGDGWSGNGWPGRDWSGRDWPGCACHDDGFGYEADGPGRRENLLAELIRVLDRHRGVFETLDER